MYFNSKGNDQFNLTPFRLPERNMCEFFNTEYKRFIMNAMKGHSTLPVGDDPFENLCENGFKTSGGEVIVYY